MQPQVTLSNVRQLELAPELAAHPLVRNRTFLTLPAKLLNLLKRDFGNVFEHDLFSVEKRLSRFVGDHDSHVGLSNGQLLPYSLLQDPRPFELTPEDARRVGLDASPAAMRARQQTVDRRLSRFGTPVRGYVGWLLTNPQFRQEHDEFFRKHRARIAEDGHPRPVLAVMVDGDSLSNVENVSADEAWVCDYRDFCRRWRLQSLAATYLPRPIAPQVPSLLPHAHGLPACEGYVTVLLPDIFPITGRGELNEMLEDVVRGNSRPEHLGEWFDIVDASNPAKNEIDHYARLFRLQHFTRVVYSRYANDLHRKLMRFRAVMAEFLEVSDDAVRRDFARFKQRLGPDWYLSPDPLTD
ncbi:MAG: hypothetical protein DWQ34_23475 [Planctomycetota bacterium]|nr:MAG: hypothetical protein DWQ34_23475 [Planctomycetota bacterium]REK19832.1 MAG: hypothetical protein DWQ41_27355 [Planctomycetota bacterium]